MSENIVLGSELGDIRFSILDPIKFKQVHGDGWELLMGNEISDEFLNFLLSAEAIFKKEPGTTRKEEYLNIYKFIAIDKKLPDVRGRFLRAMDYGDSNEDTDRKIKAVGTRQDDAVQAHTHGSMGVQKGDRNNLGDDTRNWGFITHSGTETISIHLHENDGHRSVETRPKNIAVYVYIKLNVSNDPEKETLGKITEEVRKIPDYLKKDDDLTKALIEKIIQDKKLLAPVIDKVIEKIKQDQELLSHLIKEATE